MCVCVGGGGGGGGRGGVCACVGDGSVHMYILSLVGLSDHCTPRLHMYCVCKVMCSTTI